MTRLEQLHVSGFRGIRDACLDFGGGSVVLGGANGSGKTGFVDAIEFLYTGAVSGLAGTSGISLRLHGPNVRSRPEETCVSAEFLEPEGRVTRWLTLPTEVPTALKTHMQMGMRLSFILRRSQLQQFIHAKPADRYRSMAELIGADDLDRTEIALKRARDSVQQSVETVTSRAAQLAQELKSLAPDPPTEQQLLDQANAELSAIRPDYRLTGMADVDRLRGSVIQSVAAPAVDPSVEAKRRLIVELGRRVSTDNLSSTLDPYLSLAPASAEGTRKTVQLELLQVLQRGRDYLRDTSTGHCPLCEQTVEGRLLLSRLVNRVRELEEVSLQQARIERARDELEAALLDMTGHLRTVEQVRVEASVEGDETIRLTNAIAMLQESLRGDATAETREMAERVKHGLEAWTGWASQASESLKQSEATDTQDNQQTEIVNAVLGVLDRLIAQHAEAQRAHRDRQTLERDLARLQNTMAAEQRAFDLAEASYIRFNQRKNEGIQQVYDDLQSDLARFYNFLHPGENHGILSINMDPRKRGSSELRMGFYGREGEDPRAYGSEGHLDSLGLCIFLAFVRRFNAQWPLLVLDDVVTSIDVSHKERVGRLLFQEFGDLQLFITTQDSRWLKELQAAEQETGREDSTRNLFIQSWSLDTGPLVQEAAS